MLYFSVCVVFQCLYCISVFVLYFSVRVVFQYSFCISVFILNLSICAVFKYFYCIYVFVLYFTGYQPYGNELQSFEKLPNYLKLITKVFNYELLFMRTIHVTIRCKNNAGLQTSLSSDGVVVSDRPPSAKNAQLEIISLSKSEYNARNNYQTNNHTARLKWTGFMDIIGLDSYLVRYISSFKYSFKYSLYTLS